MKATEILMEEHRVIERMLDALEIAAKNLSSGQTVPADFFLKAADFIKGFADSCHHKKEEDILFATLMAHGMSRETGPLAVMLAEHEEGRRLAHAMREGAEQMREGTQVNASQITQNALSYIALLRQHIQKEDHILYPMADQIIPAGQHPQIMAAFERIEHEDMGAGVHERYLGLVAELEEAVRHKRASKSE